MRARYVEEMPMLCEREAEDRPTTREREREERPLTQGIEREERWLSVQGRERGELAIDAHKRER